MSIKKFFSKVCGGVQLLSFSMSFTSCEGALDDILGEWSKPTPGSSTPAPEPTIDLATVPLLTSAPPTAPTAGSLVLLQRERSPCHLQQIGLAKLVTAASPLDGLSLKNSNPALEMTRRERL